MNWLVPTYASENVFQLLKKSSVWQVHSIFQQGFNLTDGQQLIFVGSVQKCLLPFGIHLAVADLQLILPKLALQNSFQVMQQELLVSNVCSVTFDMRKTNTFNSQPQKNKQSISNTHVQKWLDQYKKETKKNGLDMSSEEIAATIFFQALVNQSITEVEKGLRYFLGRGQGLTPSGDDLLVGLLAIDSLSPFLAKDFRLLLNKLLKEMITTKVSEMYLQYGSRDEYSGPVLEHLSFLTGQKDLSALPIIWGNLLSSGHTSGIDTITGMKLGLERLKGI